MVENSKSKNIGFIFCIAQIFMTLIWTFLGIRILSPGLAIAITADCINPEAPLTPKKHPLAPNLSENSLWDLAINPLWDSGEPISGS